MAPKISPEQHYERFRERRDKGDYTAVFMHGCCYHFALALHDEYRLPLEYVAAEPPAEYVPDDARLPQIGHCWALKKAGLGIDINGVHRTVVLKEIYSPACLVEPAPIEADVLRACLDARNYLPQMNEEAFDLARHIIRSHERMADARPSSIAWMEDNRDRR